jgi:hypothetical protein
LIFLFYYAFLEGQMQTLLDKYWFFEILNTFRSAMALQVTNLFAKLGLNAYVKYERNNLSTMTSTLTSIVGSKHTMVVHFGKKMYSFSSTICIILKTDLFYFYLAFWKMLKIDFWHKFSFTILVIFQMIMFFQKTFMYSHTYISLNEKPRPIFFVKSREWNSSYRIEMGQWTQM